MMAKVIRYTANWFNDGALQYEAGKHYPITAETLRHAEIGVAEEVEIDLSLENAQKAAERAAIAAGKATAAAEEARSLADAARVAQEEADQAAAIVAAAAEEEAKVRATEEAAKTETASTAAPDPQPAQ
jgi:cell division septation protein DedD